MAASVSIATSSEEINEMSIDELRNNFSSIMNDVVVSYGDDESLPVRYPPTERPDEDQ
jgi:hypothetical protein